MAHGSYIKIIAGDDTYPENRIFNSQVNCLNRSNALVVYGNLCDCDIEMNIEKVFGFYQDKMYLNVGKSNDKLFKYVCRKNPKAMATQVKHVMIESFLTNMVFLMSGLSILKICQCVFECF